MLLIPHFQPAPPPDCVNEWLLGLGEDEWAHQEQPPGEDQHQHCFYQSFQAQGGWHLLCLAHWEDGQKQKAGGCLEKEPFHQTIGTPSFILAPMARVGCLHGLGSSHQIHHQTSGSSSSLALSSGKVDSGRAIWKHLIFYVWVLWVYRCAM